MLILYNFTHFTLALLVTNIMSEHVLYFESTWDSRISNMTFPCVKCEIHKYANMYIHKNKVLKRPNMCNIFEKHGIQGYQI